MRLNKRLAKKILGEVDEERRFFVDDGRILSSLKNLWTAVDVMDEGCFRHHVNKEKNDFSTWIRECLGDVRLADGLIGLDKNASLKKIGARITYIDRYLDKKL